jgi:hypothetical protein
VATLPRVVSPIQRLFVRDGIEIALISVELWPNHLVVRLAALPGEVFDERLRQHGDAPGGHGTRVLLDLEIAVDDDAGTIYTPRSRNTGGSGSEWHGDWFFAADVPDAVGI